MTLSVILCILIFILALAHQGNVDDIVGLNRVQIVEKKKNALQTSLTILGSFAVLLLLGIILYKCFPLRHTVEVKIFGKIKEVTRWTSSHYWALFLTFLGSIGSTIGLIGSIRNYSASTKYSNMTDDAYIQYQAKVKEKNEKELKQARQAKRGYKIGQILSGLLWG